MWVSRAFSSIILPIYKLFIVLNDFNRLFQSQAIATALSYEGLHELFYWTEYPHSCSALDFNGISAIAADNLLCFCAFSDNNIQRLPPASACRGGEQVVPCVQWLQGERGSYSLKCLFPGFPIWSYISTAFCVPLG